MTLSTQHQSAHWVQWLMQSHPNLVVAMQQSNHHYSPEHLNPWHLEGDVWTHSLLVLQAYAHSDQPDVCVGLTALLHDIGKPQAARVLRERQRVVFQGHESLSAWMAWGLLHDEALSLSMPERLRIFSLIALHGCLYTGWFAEDETLKRQQLTSAFSGMGQVFWQQLLRQIGNDMQGQVTLNSNHKSQLIALDDLIQDASKPVAQGQGVPIVFLIAPPGAGKSSLRKRYQGFTVISRDDVLLQVTKTDNYRQAWQIHDEQQLASLVDSTLNAAFRHAVQQQEPILMDLTNLTRKARRRWLSQLSADYEPQARMVMASDTTLWQRNQQRADKAIPDAVLKQMLLSFEHPLCDEFADIAYVVDGREYPIGD
jgi:predicted kinase